MLWGLARRGQLLPCMSRQYPGIGPSSQTSETPGSSMPMSSAYACPFSGVSFSPLPVWHISVHHCLTYDKCSAILVALVVLMRGMVTFLSQ